MFGRKKGEQGSRILETQPSAPDLEPEHYPIREGSPFSYTSEIVEEYWDGRQWNREPGLETRFFVGAIILDERELKDEGINVSPRAVYECSLQAEDTELMRMSKAAAQMQLAAKAMQIARTRGVVLRDDQIEQICAIREEYWMAIKEVVRPELERQRQQAELSRVAELGRRLHVLEEVDRILSSEDPTGSNE